MIGKVVGHGKSVPRNLFRRNRTGVDLEWDALVWLLTPHKLWRRTFLDAHEPALPRGPAAARGPRLRDARVLRRAAHLGARRLPLLPLGAARPRRRTRRGAGSTRSRTSRSWREVLDIVDEHTEPGPFRDRLYARWYRGKMLNRVEKVHSNPDLAHRRALYEAMHELAVERFPGASTTFLPFNLRARSRLLRAGDYDGARGAGRLRDHAARAGARDRGAASRRRRRAAPRGRAGAGLRFAREGERVRVGRRRLDATSGAGRRSTMQLLLKRRATQEEYRVPAEVEPRLVDEPDGVRAVLTVTGAVIAATAAAGGSAARRRCGRSTRS